MNLRIEWTPIALQSLLNVFEYTMEEFGERQLRKLRRQIHKTENRIAAFPQMGPVEDFSALTDREYRGIVVIKEIKLIYRIDGDCIRIVYVKNTRLSEATLLKQLDIRA